jgi:hypothetical protein
MMILMMTAICPVVAQLPNEEFHSELPCEVPCGVPGEVFGAVPCAFRYDVSCVVPC